MTTTSKFDFCLTTLIAGRARRLSLLIGGAAAFLVLTLWSAAAHGSTTAIIYSFGGDEDGEYLDVGEAPVLIGCL